MWIFRPEEMKTILSMMEKMREVEDIGAGIGIDLGETVIELLDKDGVKLGEIQPFDAEDWRFIVEDG